MELIVGLIFLMLIAGIIWSIFVIKAHVEKQTAIQTAQLRMLSKIAKISGVDKDEVNKLLAETDKSLSK